MARHARTLRNILVATDLQADSRAVVAAAAVLARSADADLHLFHVVEPGGRRDRSSRGQAQEQVEEAERALRHQVEMVESGGARVKSARCGKGGPAHQQILAQREQTEADLIVLGSRTEGGGGHRLGSTADRVLRTSAVPCLIVRGEAPLPARRVAALVDFSDVARDALRLAVDWLPVLGGGRAGTELVVVHVGDEQLHNLDPGIAEFLEPKLDHERDVARKRGLEPERVTTRLLWGRSPGATAAEAAARGEFDLVVVGSHGRGPLVRALIGSVALRLSQSAPCPVLVVPPAS